MIEAAKIEYLAAQSDGASYQDDTEIFPKRAPNTGYGVGVSVQSYVLGCYEGGQI
jgi:hypothetical protein